MPDVSNLYVATGDGWAHLQREGDQWRGRVALEGSGAHSVAVDARVQSTLYCVSQSEGVWKSTDGGRRWANLSSQIGSSRISSLAIGSTGNTLYAGGSPAALWVSVDGGANWEELENLKLVESASRWNVPFGFDTSALTLIACNPQHADWLLVAIEGAGVLLSTDGGWSWDDTRAGVGRSVGALLWHPRAPASALALDESGAALSFDGGWEWQRADSGLPSSDVESHFATRAAVADGARAGVWWLLASDDSGGALFEIAAQETGKKNHPSWQRLNDGWKAALSNGGEESCVSPCAMWRGGSEWFIGAQNGAIATSSDNGQSWQALNISSGPLPALRALIGIVDS